jgi:hypothetical protein
MKLQPQSQVLSEVSVMQDSAAITLYSCDFAGKYMYFVMASGTCITGV